MKRCSRCGAENIDTKAVCEKCGEVLPFKDVAAKAPPPQPTTKPQPSGRSDPGWGLALACCGLALVASSFVVAKVNAGTVLPFGLAISTLALVRSVKEGADAGLCVSLLSMFAGIICIVLMIA